MGKNYVICFQYEGRNINITDLSYTACLIRDGGTIRHPIGRLCLKNLAVYQPDCIDSTFKKTRPPVACVFTTQRVVYK
jgi:hypothetical protein